MSSKSSGMEDNAQRLHHTSLVQYKQDLHTISDTKLSIEMVKVPIQTSLPSGLVKCQLYHRSQLGSQVLKLQSQFNGQLLLMMVAVQFVNTESTVMMVTMAL